MKDAKEGKLDPVIGRDEEIRRVVQVSIAIDVILWYRSLILLEGLFLDCPLKKFLVASVMTEPINKLDF